MEENKKQEEAPKLTYEQLAQFNQMLQSKYAEAEARLQQINNVFTRLNYLFNVLDRAPHFNEDFVIACANEIQNLLDTRQLEESDK